MADRYQEARDAITGDTWADDLARASLRAAEAKFGPPPEHEVYVTPVKYRVTIMPEACLRAPQDELYHWNLYVQPGQGRTASRGWVVTDGGNVLGRDGSWDLPSVPHHDDVTEAERQAWLANYWHESLDSALELARSCAPVRRLGRHWESATEALARHRERGMECCGR